VRLDGEDLLWLRDPLDLAGPGRVVLIPAPLVPLLVACDGTRDERALQLELQARTAGRIPPGTVRRVLEALDEALLLEGSRLQRALAEALADYRAQPFRPPALAGASYPADPAALDDLFERFGARWQAEAVTGDLDTTAEVLATGTAPGPVPPLRSLDGAAGLLSPHIDYTRGGTVYAATWEPAMAALESAEVVVVFGTDHAGSAGRLTPTLLPYATPWGPLPLDREAVDALSAGLGEGAAFGEELHHRREHSIELAVAWLHWGLRRAGRREGQLPPLVPVLCGSFHPYVQNSCLLPEGEPALAGAVDALAQALGSRKTLVVSAADLAHVGPAFGDPAPLDGTAREALARSDDALLGPVLAGSADGVLEALRAGCDRTRVCGLPPTYWTLRLLERLKGGPARGRLTGYQQCPAGEAFGSVVSIAGILWE
jgi:AmmeMemoRadiSam system protein B